MQPERNYLAVDLGASSGRAMLVRCDGRRFAWNKVHRFSNGPLQTADGLFWDAPRLFGEIKHALRTCADMGQRLSTLGIDTWGVDFGLLDANGDLLALPRHYRDPRNVAAMEGALRRVSRERIYQSTGIQFMPLNTLYQLFALANESPRTLDRAARLLFMPDLFNYWLCGRQQTERTIASTSQAMNAHTSEWDRELLAALGIPAEILPPIQPPGMLGGRLLAPVAAEVEQADASVVLTASHDTAAAVAAVPARGSDWAYISSGTWSLVGVELDLPLINSQSLAANFTNEAGVAGTVRFLKNVAGLWLLQECRRCWEEGGRSLSFAELVAMAERAAPLRSLIDPDDPRFASPGNMPARIAEACRERGQPAPADEGALVRCILDSLALRYDEVLRNAAALTARPLATVHVVGGGSQNNLLNRLIAAASDRLVIAGPAEATALGNAAVQALAVGDLPDIAAARRMIAASVELRVYEPPAGAAERDQWIAARQRFSALCAGSAPGISG
jgi:rhamnulokinase